MVMWLIAGRSCGKLSPCDCQFGNFVMRLERHLFEDSTPRRPYPTAFTFQQLALPSHDRQARMKDGTKNSLLRTLPGELLSFSINSPINTQSRSLISLCSLALLDFGPFVILLFSVLQLQTFFGYTAGVRIHSAITLSQVCSALFVQQYLAPHPLLPIIPWTTSTADANNPFSPSFLDESRCCLVCSSTTVLCST
jgi:hypothetical protein